MVSAFRSHPAEFELIAPERLVSETRADFRRLGLEFVDRVAAAGGQVATLSLCETLELDASGLGILLLLRNRAIEKGVQLKLRDLPGHARYLLMLTEMSHQFDLEE